jgi:hypothetical protein
MAEKKHPSELIASIQSREDFVAFVEALRQSFVESPEDWENQTVERFLEALGRWLEDSDGYYQNMGQPVPRRVNWKAFADALYAASIYE